MSIKITGNSNNIADVNANSELRVNLPLNSINAGFSLLGAELNTETNVGRITRNATIGAEGTLQTGNDFMLFSDNFFGAVLNTSKYKVVNTTMTSNIASGRLCLNGGNSVAINTATQVLTYKYFSFYLSSALIFDIEALITQPPVPQNTIEFGLGICSALTTPADGVYFRLNSSGELQGVANNNGSEFVQQLNYTPSPMVVNRYTIKCYADSIEYWINGKMYGKLDRGTATGQPFANTCVPIMLRMINNNALSVAQRFEICSINVSLFGTNLIRLWSNTMAGMGLNSANTADNMTAGQSANYANSTAPVSAVLSNATAGYASLGGQFQFASVAGSETDYALFAYQPIGRNMFIRGIHIETINTGAIVGTTSTVLQWALGAGATAVSLATLDSSTTGTRARRTITLGFQVFQVGTAIGVNATPIDITLDSPVLIEQGTFLHVILRMPIATATASQIIRGMVMINGFYE